MHLYELTPKMLQNFYGSLRKYHELFDAGRCQGWEQEELIVKAIKSDHTAQHHVSWKESGHDDQADIVVKVDDTKSYKIQIKSGQIRKERLVISGYRLGRFKENFDNITDYLNNDDANIIAVPYKKTDDENGRHHQYQVSYIDIDNLKGINPRRWQEHGKQFVQTNSQDVEFSLRPSMSWQIWWKIPLSLVQQTNPVVVD